MLSKVRKIINPQQVRMAVKVLKRLESNNATVKEGEKIVKETVKEMKPNTKVQIQIPVKSVGESTGKGVKQVESTKKKSMGAGTKVVLATIVGVPIVMLGGMKLSPDFFYRCETEYPRAVDFVRRFIPLNWPEKKEPIEKSDFTISMSSKELESEVTQILQNVESSLVEDDMESCEDAENPVIDEIDFDVDRAVAVLALARAAIEEENKSYEEESESLDNVETTPETEEICEVVPCEESSVEEDTEECETQESEEFPSSTEESEIVPESGDTKIVKQTVTDPSDSLDTAILEQVENTILETVTPITAELSVSLSSSLSVDLRQKLLSLQQQVRQLSVSESRRLYEALMEQKRELEKEFDRRIEERKNEVETEERQKSMERVKAQEERIRGRFEVGVTKMENLFHQSQKECEEESQEDGRAERERMRERVKEEWAVRTQSHLQQILRDASEVRVSRTEEMNRHQAILRVLTEKNRENLESLEEAEKNQEFQKSIINLQQAVLEGTPLGTPISELKSQSANDPILLHILDSVPESILQNGVHTSAYFYASFNQLLHEARVAAKVPANSGLAGQLLGRTVVALMGVEGVNENDPLVRLDSMRLSLLKGDLQEAYEVGRTLENGAGEVLESWLKEVEDALQVEKAMKELILHIKRNEFYSVCSNKQFKQHLSYNHAFSHWNHLVSH